MMYAIISLIKHDSFSGVSTGLFFYGVAEPVYHYTGHNRYTADPTVPDNTLAQIAMNITLFHWGNYIIFSQSDM